MDSSVVVVAVGGSGGLGGQRSRAVGGGCSGWRGRDGRLGVGNCCGRRESRLAARGKGSLGVAMGRRMSWRRGECGMTVARRRERLCLSCWRSRLSLCLKRVE